MKCPLCKSEPTKIVYPFSDQIRELPIEYQKCSNNQCELPCKLWVQMQQYVSLAKDYMDYLKQSAEKK